MPNPIKRQKRGGSYLLVTDWLIIVATFIIALQFRRYSPELRGITPSHWAVVPEVIAVSIYALFFLITWAILGLYKRYIWLTPTPHALQIIKGSAGLVLGYVLLLALTKASLFTPSRMVILVWFVLMLALLSAHRLLFFPFLLRVASRSGLRRRVVLLGDSQVTKDLLSRFEHEAQYSMLTPVGILSAKTGPFLNQDIPHLGDFSALPNIVELYNLEGAVIAEPDLSVDELMSLIEQCVSLFGWVDVHSEQSAAWYNVSGGSDTYFDIPFVRINAITQTPILMAYKRVFDFSAALLGLLVLSPLLVTLAVLIKASSPGPVFFTRERIGEKGQPFKFYKFRSMRVEAEHDTSRTEAVLKFMKDDSAIAEKFVNEAMITPVGRFIRKWALDEVPQLWNVLKGDMSLVGPRPLPLEEYEAQDEWQKRRFDVKPGCTGLWKIMVVRHRGVTFANASLYDLYYARNMSPVLDLNILLNTVMIILRGKADG